MNLTTYFANKLADHNNRPTDGARSYRPAALYAVLFAADPTAAGSFANEITTNGNARVVATTAFAVAAGGVSLNSGALAFPSPTGNWTVPATHWGIADASTGGNLLWYGALDDQVLALSGQAPTFPISTFALGFR